MSGTYHKTDMELYGCFNCRTVGGEYREHVGGSIECLRCGSHTVVPFSHCLEIMSLLEQAELLDDYHNLIEYFGVLRFEEGDDDGYYDD